MGLALAAVAVVVGIKGRNDAQHAAEDAANFQRQAQAEQRAGSAAQAALERRNQIREQRIKSARVEQASMNTGVAGSSGEIGAESSMSTQLASNVAFNIGAVQRGSNISMFNQQAADANLRGQRAQIRAQNAQSLFQLGNDIATQSASIFK
jgi:hypothetical protein